MTITDVNFLVAGFCVCGGFVAALRGKWGIVSLNLGLAVANIVVAITVRQ